MFRRRSTQDVELNMAAMLDMAFQLLTFFILTFRPPPLEGQISMRLPPADAVIAFGGTGPTGQPEGKNPRVSIQGVNTLKVCVFSEAGGIDRMIVGDTSLGSLGELRGKFQEIFGDRATPFDQIALQVSDCLRYGEMFRVVELCTQQTLPNGRPLGKLSFSVVGRTAGE